MSTGIALGCVLVGKLVLGLPTVYALVLGTVPLGYGMVMSHFGRNHPKSLEILSRHQFKSLKDKANERLASVGLGHECVENVVHIPTSDKRAILDTRILTRRPKATLETKGGERHEHIPDVAVILTHPWGRLGGDMNFPIVAKLARYFAHLGFTVCRFDFRGVGESSGSPTFSGSGEENDLNSVIDYLLENGGKEENLPKITKILLIGYSYGSVISSSVGGIREEVMGIVTISYPYSWVWALVVLNSRRMLRNAKNAKKKLFLMGSSDEFTSYSSFFDLVRFLGPNTSAILAESYDHSWWKAELSVFEAIATWLENTYPQFQLKFCK
ncbi:hypothetical protein AAMO2058_000555800 [Amorphochlora amoebiformis]